MNYKTPLTLDAPLLVFMLLPWPLSKVSQLLNDDVAIHQGLRQQADSLLVGLEAGSHRLARCGPLLELGLGGLASRAFLLDGGPHRFKCRGLLLKLGLGRLVSSAFLLELGLGCLPSLTLSLKLGLHPGERRAPMLELSHGCGVHLTLQPETCSRRVSSFPRRQPAAADSSKTAQSLSSV